MSWLIALFDRFRQRPILLVSQASIIVSYPLLVFAVPSSALLDHLSLPFGLAGGLVIIY